MENFPNQPQEKNTWKKLRGQMKSLGIALPLVANQANAIQNPFDTDPLIDKEAATAPVAEQGETIGEPENYSVEEWKLLNTYRNHALWGTDERITVYSRMENGAIIQIPGETILGKIGGQGEMSAQIRGLPEYLQKVIVHQHPIISGYSGLYQKSIGQYDPEKQSPEERDLSKAEEKILIEKIRHNELLSAWPPSATDIATAVFNKEKLARVVDANGVWVFSIDKTSKKGKKIISHGNWKEVFQKKMEERGYSKSKYEEYIEEAKQMRKDPKYSAPSGFKEFLTAKSSAENEAKVIILGELDYVLKNEYRAHQIATAKPTEDKKAWETGIRDFISFCKDNGLRVNYTPFK